MNPVQEFDQEFDQENLIRALLQQLDEANSRNQILEDKLENEIEDHGRQIGVIYRIHNILLSAKKLGNNVPIDQILGIIRKD